MTDIGVHQLAIKLFATGDVEDEAFIPVFHRWIREGVLPGKLLIDVADYRHVPSGPGVMLIGDTVHYSMDHEQGLGLLAAQRRDEPGPLPEKLAVAVADALEVAAQLEREFPELSFSLERLEVQVRSRIVITLDSDEVRDALGRLLGIPVSVTPSSFDPRGPSTVALAGQEAGLSAGKLFGRLSGHRPLAVQAG